MQRKILRLHLCRNQSFKASNLKSNDPEIVRRPKVPAVFGIEGQL